MHPRLLITAAALALASLALSLALGPALVHALAAHASLPLVFAAAGFVLLLVGVVPGALLGLAAGALYGTALGFALSAASVLAAAAVAFGLSRSFLRPTIAGLLQRHGWMARLDGALTEDSWHIVALLRISPVMPFSLTSYALGLSGISFTGYALGTLASLPPLLGYVVIGMLGRAGAGGGTWLHEGLTGFGILATLALTVHLTHLATRALKVPAKVPLAQNPG
jgi:uncharacterized membrane protein YdjX (TVP38/TMEM64 family)